MSGRSTPRQPSAADRNSRNLSHIRNATLTGAPGGGVPSSLRSTQIVTQKAVLPAELLEVILDHVAIPDLMRFARVSRRLNEMVYDDTRWIQKLRTIGVWNEAEARQRFDAAMRKRAESQKTKAQNASGAPITLFDAGEEGQARTLQNGTQHQRKATLKDGFDELTLSPSSPLSPPPAQSDSAAALQVLNRVKSVRGFARQEFAKIYAALAPHYYDLARAKSHSDPLLFRTFRDPEQQAQILSNLSKFARCDQSLASEGRHQKLLDLISVFETAALREFDQGYAAGDVDGRMRRYAHVLVVLNGGTAAVEAFISNHPVLQRTMRLGNPLSGLEDVAPGHVDLNPVRQYFQRLASIMIEQANIVDTVFPDSVDVLTPFLARLCDQIVSEYLTAFFDEAHERGVETYVKAVAGALEQSLRFVASLQPPKASPNFTERARELVTDCYEKHLDLYLAEELTFFTNKADAEVTHWEKEQSEQEANTESFFMSNVSRQAAKRDFLSSFKKVVMMPVNVIPTFAPSKPAAQTAHLSTVDTSYSGARSQTPPLTDANTPARSSTPSTELPTTELAAKAAIMNSRLEGIKTLFSIEVALNLTHMAKASVERAATVSRLGGKYGEDAKAQCGAVFVALLSILGNRHVKNGFDRAVTHLGNYSPREVRRYRGESQTGSLAVEKAGGVEPLVTFLELVNVGDLIQQMLDVFYSQELVAAKLTDRDDFLDPTSKEKKRFESMLDDRVAAGLNKGIDVLIDEVEYIFASTQLAADYNPGSDGTAASGAATALEMDIGPSATAKQVVDLIQGHTSMLVGSTDKNMLDVFIQEVGLRLFGALCKHFKRQRISVTGAIKLISDINHYSAFISSLRQKQLQPYFTALRELGQIYLVHIDPPAAYFTSNSSKKKVSSKGSTTSNQAKELAAIIADTQRYHGIFGAEEVYEFAERRADWYLVKSDVERAMYGVGCSIM